MCTGRYLLSTK